MAMQCMNCGKGIVVGNQQRHHRGVAGKRWKKRAQATTKIFKPNLQNATVLLDGKTVKVKVCTRCLKRFKKENMLAHQATNFASV